MLNVPLYTTGRHRPEVAPLAPLGVAESVLSSDTHSLGLVLDFELTDVCGVVCQGLRRENHMSVANFIQYSHSVSHGYLSAFQ